MLCVASAVLPISHDLIQRAIRVNQAKDIWPGLGRNGHVGQFEASVSLDRRRHPPRTAGRTGRAAESRLPTRRFSINRSSKRCKPPAPNADIRIRDTVDYQAATYRSITVRQLYSVSPSLHPRAPAVSRSSLCSRFNGQPFPVKACRAG